MKLNLRSLALISYSALATLAGCASSSTYEAPVGGAASAHPEPAPDLSGTWALALGMSDVAKPARERCAASGAEDTGTAEACWNAIATEAAHEKIRFRKDGAGRVTWTSLGSEGPHEKVFLEFPVELAADGPGWVVMKIAGVPKGEHAAQFTKSNTRAMRVEVVDARTIAMNDPKKGRLVFAKE